MGGQVSTSQPDKITGTEAVQNVELHSEDGLQECVRSQEQHN